MKNTDKALGAIDSLSEITDLGGRQKILLIDAMTACARLAKSLGAGFAEGYVAGHILNLTKGGHGKKEE